MDLDSSVPEPLPALEDERALESNVGQEVSTGKANMVKQAMSPVTRAR